MLMSIVLYLLLVILVDPLYYKGCWQSMSPVDYITASSKGCDKLRSMTHGKPGGLGMAIMYFQGIPVLRAATVVWNQL